MQCQPADSLYGASSTLLCFLRECTGREVRTAVSEGDWGRGRAGAKDYCQAGSGRDGSSLIGAGAELGLRTTVRRGAAGMFPHCHERQPVTHIICSAPVLLAAHLQRSLPHGEPSPGESSSQCLCPLSSQCCPPPPSAASSLCCDSHDGASYTDTACPPRSRPHSCCSRMTKLTSSSTCPPRPRPACASRQ